MPFARLVANKAIKHDAAAVTPVAGYLASFWHVEGDPDMRVMEALAEQALARLESGALQLPYLMDVLKNTLKLRTPEKRKAAMKRQFEKLRRNAPHLAALRESFKDYLVHYDHRGHKLVAHPDAMFFDTSIFGFRLPLLGIFANEPGPRETENIAPHLSPEYTNPDELRRRAAEAPGDPTMYNLATHFMIIMQLTADVEKDEALVWCYGPTYGARDYEVSAASSSTCADARGESNLLVPTEDVLDLVVLAYVFDTPGRFSHLQFVPTGRFSLDTIKDYYEMKSRGTGPARVQVDEIAFDMMQRRFLSAAVGRGAGSPVGFTVGKHGYSLAKIGVDFEDKDMGTEANSDSNRFTYIAAEVLGLIESNSWGQKNIMVEFHEGDLSDPDDNEIHIMINKTLDRADDDNNYERMINILVTGVGVDDDNNDNNTIAREFELSYLDASGNPQEEMTFLADYDRDTEKYTLKSMASQPALPNDENLEEIEYFFRYKSPLPDQGAAS